MAADVSGNKDTTCDILKDGNW